MILNAGSASSNSLGADDYSKLKNKPKINDIELNGNKTLDELGIQQKGNYITDEIDPTVPEYVKNITEEDITTWNNKSDFSGNYEDLKNIPETKQASETVLGGIKASNKTEEETAEVKIDPVTGKLYSKYNSGGESGGTTDYTLLSNKPSINSIELVGNVTTEQLGIKDGVSPTVTLTPIENGTKMTVIDSVGEKTTNILNGKDGTLPIERIESDATGKAVIELKPSVFYMLIAQTETGGVSDLTVSFRSDPDQKHAGYFSLIFTSGPNGCNLTAKMPGWVGGNAPTIRPNYMYELNVSPIGVGILAEIGAIV